MLLAIWIAGCGSSEPTVAAEPNARATEAVVRAVCDLVKGAGHDCTGRTREVVIDGDTPVSVQVFLDKVEDTLGLVTIDGRAKLTLRDKTITTRFDLHGMGEEQAYERGVHLWAVLAGAPIVDWALPKEPRPALTALYRQTPQWVAHPPVDVGSFKALEGWTLLQGVHAALPHREIVGSFASVAAALPADGPHMVEIHASGDVGEQVFTCHVDGDPAPELCAAARSAPWPAGVGWVLRQAYLLVPADTAPTVPIPPPAEAPAAGDED